MSYLKLLLMGPPQIEAFGKVLTLQRRKAMALLAYLAVTKRNHSRESLATMFWPESDQSAALAQLRIALSSIRKSLGENWLDHSRDPIGVNQDADLWLDMAEFQKHLFAVRNHRHPQGGCPDCRVALEQAVQLYRDDFMAGFNLPHCPDFDDWQFFMREGLRSDLSASLQGLIQEHAITGDFETAIPHARHWVKLDTLHEPAHCALMRLYAHASQRSAALHQYSECKRTLHEELGVQPQTETRQLYLAILEQNETFAAQDQRWVLSEISRPRHNLPIQAIPFVWREDIMPEIQQRLDNPSCRLLSLVGPGGCGKTRLAIEAAALLLDLYPDGVFFVSLEPLGSVDAIVPTIAEAVGFSFYKAESDGKPIEPRQQLLNFLARKSMLLILDNYEHLLEGASLTTEIIKAASQVKILATSRARLNVFEEQVSDIPGMQHPTADDHAVTEALQYSAIQLFLQSAHWAQPGFELSSDNLSLVIRICRLVEGMPLGILLAAAWLRLLPLLEIADEIKNGLDLLEGELRDLPERQRSLRAVFESSWGMLSQHKKEVFAALSVFRGGCTREAARVVTGASLRELMTLVDRSLLQRDVSGRFRMHRLLRQYASEQLAEDPEGEQTARDRHSAYFAERLQDWEGDLKGPSQATAVAEMDIEIENCRVAWVWAAMQRRVDWLHSMLEGLFLYHDWGFRYQEGAEIFRLAAEKLAGITSNGGLCIMSRILVRQALFSFSYVELEEVQQFFEKAQCIFEDSHLAGQDIRQEQADFLRWKGYAFCDTPLSKDAGAWLEQSLKLYREMDDDWAVGNILFDLARVRWMVGNSEDALRFFKESEAACRIQGDLKGLSRSLSWQSGFIAGSGQLEEAEKMLQEAISITRQIGDSVGLGLALICLALYVYFVQGKFSESEPLMKECIRLTQEIGDQPDLALAKWGLGAVKLCLGEYQYASLLFDESLKISQEVNSPRGVAFALWGLSLAKITANSFTEALVLCQKGVPLVRDDQLPHIEKAYLMGGLGTAACINQQLSLAQSSLRESLQYYIDVAALEEIKWVLPACALFQAMKGQVDRAVELYALVTARFPFVAKAKFMEDIYGQRIHTVAASLPPEVVATAKERGRARDLWDTARELLAWLKEE